MKPALLLVINPKAGRGTASSIEALIGQSGLREKFEVSVVSTSGRGHAVELSKEARDNGFKIVVAAGGDGTVNEIASSLVGGQTALGIIPAGSGNGLARHLNYPINPLRALQKIKDGSIEIIDTLLINNRFALNVSGFGFDGYVAWLFDRHGKRGLMTYAKIAMREYFRYPAVDFNITIDNKQFNTTAQMVVIANASQFGNAAIIAPYADLKDGSADVIIVKRPPLLFMPSTFYRLFNGSLQSNNFISMLTCKMMTVTTSRPVHLHIDGEPCEPVSKIDVVVKPDSLAVLT